MIDYRYRNLFHQSSIDKQWTITDGEITLTNSDIYSEEIELNESICSENNIVFGSCESSTLSFTTSCLTQMLGRRLEVSMVLEGHDDEPFVVGTFTVIEDELTSDRRKRQVRAYDDLYFINNANVAEWYNGLNFPLTLKQFRDSFFTNFNITQETTTLPNDNMTIEKTVEAEVLSGATVIKSICELNGRCGHIDRQGVFRYLPIYIGGKGLYPSLTLYPSNRLFPSESAEGGKVSPMEVEEYEKIEYADYEVKPIDKLQIRQEENDVGAIVGTGDNSYIVEDNFLVYGKDAQELEDVATNMFGEINKIKYTPSDITCVADPCVEVGDILRIYKTDGNTLYSYVLSRTIKGLQNLKDNVICKGSEYQEEEVNGLSTEIIQLKGKTTKISKTVDGIETIVEEDIFNTENPQSLVSKISQNAQEIEAKVSETYGNSSSAFSWVLKSTGFDVKNSGTSVFKVNSSGAEINGKITAKSGYIGNGSQGFTIGNTSIYNGTNSMSSTANGIYLGTDGINLGGGKFKVTNAGALTSTSGNIGSFTIDTGFKYKNGNDTLGYILPATAGGYGGIEIGGQTVDIQADRSVNIGKSSLGTTGVGIEGYNVNITASKTTISGSTQINCSSFLIKDFPAVNDIFAAPKQVGSSYYIWGRYAYYNGSDRRIKQDIETLDVDKTKDFIMKLNPCEYRLKEMPERKHHGFIAQEIKESMYEDWSVYLDDGELMSLAYTELIADMVVMLQSQQKEIEELKRKAG